jgi:hypothetical protein
LRNKETTMDGESVTVRFYMEPVKANAPYRRVEFWIKGDPESKCEQMVRSEYSVEHVVNAMEHLSVGLAFALGDGVTHTLEQCDHPCDWEPRSLSQMPPPPNADEYLTVKARKHIHLHPPGSPYTKDDPYEVAYSRCHNAELALHWLHHLHEKVWFEHPTPRMFIEAWQKMTGINVVEKYSGY